jgi:hypothetical protein
MDPDPQHNTKQTVPPLTELYEGRLAGGHLHYGAAQGPDVGRGAVPTLPFVNHLHKREEIYNKQQCCRSGSGTRILCLLDPWIRDPGWVKKSGSGSGVNDPDHNSESLETNFWGQNALIL